MSEENLIWANIARYQELLQTSPEHPQRSTIERLLAEEREKLKQLGEVGDWLPAEMDLPSRPDSPPP